MLGLCYQYLSLPLCPCFILIPASCPTQGHHMYSMCPDIIFQTLPSCSRLCDVTSCDLLCDFIVTCLFIVLQEKEKAIEIEKEIEK